MTRIKAAWPKLADQSLSLYAGFVRETANRHGRSAVDKLIREAINREPELPSIAKLKMYLPVEVRQVKTSTNPQCPECEGSGWMRVFAGNTTNGNPVDAVQGAVRRCHCWRKESA